MINKFIISFLIFNILSNVDNIVYYIPPYDNNINSGHYIDNMFLNLMEPSGQYTGFRYAFVRLKEILSKIGFELKLVSPQKNYDNAYVVIDHDFNHPSNDEVPIYGEYLQYIPFDKRVLIMGEPPMIIPRNYYGINTNDNILPGVFNLYNKVLAIVDDPYYIDLKNNNLKVDKIYFPQPILKMIEPIKFNQKKLLIFVGGDKTHMFSNEGDENGYLQRKKWSNFCVKNNYDYEIYGGYSWTKWDDLSSIYKGLVPLVEDDLVDINITRGITDKINLIKNYKFYLCYENQINCNGWITEKIFEAFISGCVPIYWGAKNIDLYIPRNCFIDRNKFSSDQEIYNFISYMSEFEYNMYLDNIRNFLKSDKVCLFSVEYFLYKIIKMLNFQIDYGSLFSLDELEIIEKAKQNQVFINSVLNKD